MKNNIAFFLMFYIFFNISFCKKTKRSDNYEDNYEDDYCSDCEPYDEKDYNYEDYKINKHYDKKVENFNCIVNSSNSLSQSDLMKIFEIINQKSNLNNDISNSNITLDNHNKIKNNTLNNDNDLSNSNTVSNNEYNSISNVCNNTNIATNSNIGDQISNFNQCTTSCISNIPMGNLTNFNNSGIQENVTNNVFTHIVLDYIQYCYNNVTFELNNSKGCFSYLNNTSY